MPLVEIHRNGEKAGYRMWINTHRVIEVAETRERDYVKMAGSGGTGPYTFNVDSAAATAKAIMDVEDPNRRNRVSIP